PRPRAGRPGGPRDGPGAPAGGWGWGAEMKIRTNFPARLLAMILGALSVLGGSWVAPRLGLGQEAAEPGGDLLRSVPFDRITLNDGAVLVVEPISPRPLPPYDP